MNIKRFSLIFVLALVGCLSKTQSGPPQIADYGVREDDVLGYFEVRFTNALPHPICLTADQWPNADGALDSDGISTYVEIDNVHYFNPEINEYCASCVYRVSSGKTIVGRLYYKNFGIPISAYRKSKKLHFAPLLSHCLKN